MTIAGMILIALGIEALIGWPEALYRRIGHPVVWIGHAITWGDQEHNQGTDHYRRWMGAGMTVALILWVAILGAVIGWLLPGGWLGLILGGVLIWPLLASRSLHEHVEAVLAPLEREDKQDARAAVSKIVGRNPETLDMPAIRRASLESLAENASDGVVAPVFWGLIFGLPGLFAYKTINTLDSMIGHKTEQYSQFGWAAARIDDVANWIPARLTGLLFALSAKARGTSYRTMMRDGGLHRSPNAGWPEAAMAGALGVRLSGPRDYEDGPSDDPWLNAVGGDPTNEDLRRGLRLYRHALAWLAVFLLICALVF